jgi:hypothetical protein
MPPSAISTPSPSRAAVTKLMSMCLFSDLHAFFLRGFDLGKNIAPTLSRPTASLPPCIRDSVSQAARTLRTASTTRSAEIPAARMSSAGVPDPGRPRTAR